MQTIETPTYPLYNYSTSKIIVVLRNGSIPIESGTRDQPAAYPFTMSELQQIASNSSVIQVGYLRPAKEDAKFIYETLRIRDWQNILTEEDIEQMILNPTVEGLTRLINIKDAFYFERVYGIFIGLKNVNAPIADNVARLIKGRYKELQKGKINTDYVVKEKDISSMKTFMAVETSDTANEVAALKDELSDKDAIIAELRKQLAAQKADAKPAAKTVKRKTTTKKPAEG